MAKKVLKWLPSQLLVQNFENLYNIFLQVNITLRAWDKGSPTKSGQVVIHLEVVTSNSNSDGDETVHLEVDEGLPAGLLLHDNSLTCDWLDIMPQARWCLLAEVSVSCNVQFSFV